MDALKRELKNNPFRFMLSSVYDGDLTLEKLFAEILVKTSHGKKIFEIPLIQQTYSSDSRFAEDLKEAEKLDKNFDGANWNEFK